MIELINLISSSWFDWMYSMFWQVSLLIFFSLTIIAATNVSENEQQLRKIVEPLNEKYINSILDDDLETYLSSFTEDAIVMIPFIPTIEGRHALTVHWHNKMTRGRHVGSVDVETLDIWSSEDLIYERGSYQITFKKYHNNIKAVYGSYFTVWQKQADGSYKMKYDISNLNHKI
jgi:ketosteroid isomerase-like protein